MTSGTETIDCPHCGKTVHVFVTTKIKINEAWHINTDKITGTLTEKEK